MLIFKYTDPFYLQKENIYKEKEIKPIDSIVTKKSSHPQMEYAHLKNRIINLKIVINKIKNNYMKEEFLPKSLKPISLDSYPSSYTECSLFIEMLTEYYKFLLENKVSFYTSEKNMTNLIGTMILIENKEAKIITNDYQLKAQLEDVVKKYRKYHITLYEK